jgi:hypothetical protein
LEKLVSFRGAFGNLAEGVLANRDIERDKCRVLADLMKLKSAFPNFEPGAKAFVPQDPE